MKLKGTEKCMNIIDNALRKLKIEMRKLPKKSNKGRQKWPRESDRYRRQANRIKYTSMLKVKNHNNETELI